ncbi:MAG TPA: class I SAM-dependent methyltransferase [Gemmatimonadales bacterium]|nr:class I SAM-dependent methyltransferase [Gemmatimonadales bacterium]
MRPPADHFSRRAPAYASHRPNYPEELFDYLDAHVPGHALAWDCGAGSGQATIPLARRFSRVIATDISPAMLQYGPPHPAVEYRVAPAEASGLADACVDLVTVAQALHWLDTETFYPEAARVLVPGGVLAVWTYGEQRLDEPALDHAVRNFYSNIVGPYWPAERRHVESGYRTLSFPFPEIEPPELVMQETWNLAQLLGYVGTWSATQRFFEVVGHDPVDGLWQDLEQHWGDQSASRRIRWPISLRLGLRPG